MYVRLILKQSRQPFRLKFVVFPLPSTFRQKRNLKPVSSSDYPHSIFLGGKKLRRNNSVPYIVLFEHTQINVTKNLISSLLDFLQFQVFVFFFLKKKKKKKIENMNAGTVPYRHSSTAAQKNTNSTVLPFMYHHPKNGIRSTKR